MIKFIISSLSKSYYIRVNTYTCCGYQTEFTYTKITRTPPLPFYLYISFFSLLSCIYMYTYCYINELIPKEFPNIYRSSLNFFTLSLLAWSSASRFFLSSSISFSTRVWNFSQLWSIIPQSHLTPLFMLGSIFRPVPFMAEHFS